MFLQKKIEIIERHRFSGRNIEVTIFFSVKENRRSFWKELNFRKMSIFLKFHSFRRNQHFHDYILIPFVIINSNENLFLESIDLKYNCDGKTNYKRDTHTDTHTHTHSKRDQSHQETECSIIYIFY